MGSLTFSKSQIIPALYGGCGLRGITCISTSGMLAVYEEFSIPGTPPHPQRVFLSSDNGATFAEPGTSPIWTQDTIWYYQVFSTSFDTLLVGNEGPQALITPATGIPRSTDGGATWSGATDALFNPATDTWVVRWFVDLGSSSLLAVGRYLIGGVTRHILKSTDGGATFGSPQTLTPSAGTIDPLLCGVETAGGTILLGAQFADQSPRLYRSTNAGVTYSEIVLPNTQHAYTAGQFSQVLSIVGMDSNVVLACGSSGNGISDYPTKLWRSTDDGATWAEITDSIPGRTPNTNTPGAFLLRLDGQRSVFCAGGAPNNLTGTNFFLTEDAGANWSAQTVSGGYTGGGAVLFSPRYGSIAGDGTVVLTAGWTGDGGNNEIWRGVAAGFTPASPCAGFVSPTSAASDPCADVRGTGTRR